MSLTALLLIPFLAKSQDQEESNALKNAYAHAKAFYFKALGSEAGLYDGVIYKEFAQHPNDEGQPYFETDDWVEGGIFYNGMHYERIPMLYDVVNDKLVIDHAFSAVKLELISEKIKFFELNDHRFIRLTITDPNAPLRTGFFEVLYEGQCKLYAKWQKKRIEVIVARELQVRYENQNKIYIHKENKFYPVKSKSSVLQVFEDKKPLLQKYIKKNHLKFRNNRAESIAKILAFYESGTE